MTVTLEFSASQRDFVDAQVAAGQYSDAATFILALIERERRRDAKRQLEASLVEALNGENHEMTDEAWDGLEREALGGITPHANP